MRDLNAIADGIIVAIKGYIARAVEPLERRAAAIEARFAALEKRIATMETTNIDIGRQLES